MLSYLNSTVGRQIGNGQCGQFAIAYMQHINQTNWISFGNATLDTAWNWFSTADWSNTDWEVVSTANPQVGDVFFVSPRIGLPTGHVGVIGENGTTYEQNYGGRLYVQHLSRGSNSLTYYGINGLVRKRQPKKETVLNNTPQTRAGMIYLQVASKDPVYSLWAGKLTHITNRDRYNALNRVFGQPTIEVISQAEFDLLRAHLREQPTV